MKYCLLLFTTVYCLLFTTAISTYGSSCPVLTDWINITCKTIHLSALPNTELKLNPHIKHFCPYTKKENNTLRLHWVSKLIWVNIHCYILEPLSSTYSIISFRGNQKAHLSVTKVVDLLWSKTFYLKLIRKYCMFSTTCD